MPLVRIDDITDGMVSKPFKTDDGSGNLKTLMPGTRLSHEQIRKIPIGNRAALFDKGFITANLKRISDTTSGSDRFVVPLGFGHYDVVEGRKLNTSPVDREKARELAGLPPPEAKPARPKARKAR